MDNDLISRKALKDGAYINRGNFNTVEGIREWIDNAPTVETSIEHFVDLKTFKQVDCEYLTPCGICKFKSSDKQIIFCNEFQPT